MDINAKLNSAYMRHRISRPMQIVAPKIPKNPNFENGKLSKRETQNTHRYRPN